jgi:hypothetical protein
MTAIKGDPYVDPEYTVAPEPGRGGGAVVDGDPVTALRPAKCPAMGKPMLPRPMNATFMAQSLLGLHWVPARDHGGDFKWQGQQPPASTISAHCGFTPVA